jgi:TPR repeat protein
MPFIVVDIEEAKRWYELAVLVGDPNASGRIND